MFKDEELETDRGERSCHSHTRELQGLSTKRLVQDLPFKCVLTGPTNTERTLLFPRGAKAKTLGYWKMTIKFPHANSNVKAPEESWGTLFKSKFLPEDAETLNFFLVSLDK